MTIFKNLIIISSLLFSYAWGAHTNVANRALRESFLRENDAVFAMHLKIEINDPNAVVNITNGQTAFQYAVYKSSGSPEMRLSLKSILEKYRSEQVQSYIQTQDKDGNNALHYAAIAQNHYFFNLLKARNPAAALVRNSSGQSPDDLLKIDE